MTGAPATSKATAEFAEVWGDTVKLHHLVAAIGVGSVLSLSAYFAAKAILAATGHVSPQEQAYAMLAGLVGCLIGGFACVRLFPPKRVLAEIDQDSSARQDAITAALAAQPGWDAPLLDVTKREIESLGLAGVLAAPSGPAARPARSA